MSQILERLLDDGSCRHSAMDGYVLQAPSPDHASDSPQTRSQRYMLPPIVLNRSVRRQSAEESIMSEEVVATTSPAHGVAMIQVNTRRPIETVVKCRRVGVLIALGYIITLLAWPSYFVPLLGLLTGAAGFISAHKPHKMSRVCWAHAFIWLNVAMITFLLCTVVRTIVWPDSSAVDYAAGRPPPALLVVFAAAGIALHLSAHRIGRMYLREFKMRAALSTGSFFGLDSDLSASIIIMPTQ